MKSHSHSRWYSDLIDQYTPVNWVGTVNEVGYNCRKSDWTVKQRVVSTKVTENQERSDLIAGEDRE